MTDRYSEPRKQRIIAVDFDGCLATNRFPDIGEPIIETIEALRAEQNVGAKTILWTCRRDEQLEAAVAWCTQQGIRLDAINCNLPEIVAAFGGDTIKVYATEYWDDRAVRMPPAPESDGWISVKDRLPEMIGEHKISSDRVLVAMGHRNKIVVFGYWDGGLDTKQWVTPDNTPFSLQDAITHWRPLPTPPRE